MPKFRIYGTVTGSTYLGEYEGDTKEDAIAKAQEEEDLGLCHQCSEKCEDPQITEYTAEEVDDEEE